MRGLANTPDNTNVVEQDKDKPTAVSLFSCLAQFLFRVRPSTDISTGEVVHVTSLTVRSGVGRDYYTRRSLANGEWRNDTFPDTRPGSCPVPSDESGARTAT